MSEDADDSQKTEDPTAKRLQDARRRGQVAISREVNTWIILFGAALMFALFLPGMMLDLKSILQGVIERSYAFPTDEAGFINFVRQLLGEVFLVLAIPFGIFVFLALFAGIAQIGLVLSPKAMEPKLEKFSPISGAKRILGAKGFVEFLKGMLKIALIGTIGFLLLLPELNRLDTIPFMPAEDILKEIDGLFFRLMIGVLAVLVVIAIADLTFQRYQHTKKLRMTKQEVKEEFKNSEGDPQIKGRLRAIRMERHRQRMAQAVPRADVVVTNPTHFSVALKYDPDEMEAPVLVAKGQDILAFRIRELAKEHDIPIVENPPLARALYATVDVDESIPPEHFEAVAKVISYVFNIKGRRMPA